MDKCGFDCQTVAIRLFLIFCSHKWAKKISPEQLYFFAIRVMCKHHHGTDGEDFAIDLRQFYYTVAFNIILTI